MKTENFKNYGVIKRLGFLSLVLVSVLLMTWGCKKEKLVFVTEMGGSPEQAITEIGNETEVSFKVGDLTLPSTMEVKDRDADGVVTYDFTLDFSSLPTATRNLIEELIPDKYQDGPYKVSTDFKVRITSEGYQDFFFDETPWIAFRYDDPVGTKYLKEGASPDKWNYREVTEKTGENDFAWGGMLIKTSKIEQTFKPGSALTGVGGSEKASKLVMRANHRFGLVFLEFQLTNGEKVEVTFDHNYFNL